MSANTIGFDFNDTETLVISLIDSSPQIFSENFVEDTIKRQKDYVVDKFLEHVHNTNNSITIPTNDDAIVEKAIELGVAERFADPNTVNLSSNAEYTVELSNSDILVVLTSNSDVQAFFANSMFDEVDSAINEYYDSYISYKRENGEPIYFSSKEEALQNAIDEDFYRPFNIEAMLFDPVAYFEDED